MQDAMICGITLFVLGFSVFSYLIFRLTIIAEKKTGRYLIFSKDWIRYRDVRISFNRTCGNRRSLQRWLYYHEKKWFWRPLTEQQIICIRTKIKICDQKLAKIKKQCAVEFGEKRLKQLYCSDYHPDDDSRVYDHGWW